MNDKRLMINEMMGYGNDASGQRTYKMQLSVFGSNTNTFPNTKILDVEKMQLYPNGFININQDGNYTKHYYAGSARIASKIGGGFDDNITCTTDNLKVDYLLEVMKTELGKLTNETVDDIENNFAQITHLIGEDPKNYEDGLFFYHGNHLSSTQLITDMYGAVSQAILYAPFGQILSEYRADWMLDTIPRFLFSGKILDEESGLNYFEARYQDPKWGGFISRDPKFEKYWWISPYAYCANNPVKYIDPDGRIFKDWNKKEMKDGDVVNGFRSESERQFFNTTFTTLNQGNKIFASVYKQLKESKKNTYSVFQDAAYHLGYGGVYRSETRRIELFSRSSTMATIFEEFFHAGQHEYYGEKYNTMGTLAREFEAKVACIYSAATTNNPALLENDDVLSKMSSSDMDIITKSLQGKKVDAKALNNAFNSLKNNVIDVYKLDKNSKIDFNKSLEYLKTLIE